MSSFWGLELQFGKTYSKVVSEAFHISSAVLDVGSCSENNIISVILENEGKKYILCNLSIKDSILQAPLDLQFSEGDQILLSLRGGSAKVHLTGFNLMSDDLDMEEYEEEEEEEEKEIVSPKRKKESGDELKLSVENSETDVNLSKKRKRKNRQKLNKGQKKDENVSSSPNESKFSKNGLGALMLNGDHDSEDEEEDEDYVLEDLEEDVSMEEEYEDDDDEEYEDDDEEEEEEKPVKIKKPKLEAATPGPKSPSISKANQELNKTPSGDATKNKKFKAEKEKSVTKSLKSYKSGGIVSEDLKVGDGPQAKTGKMAFVYYEARLKSNGKLFDKTVSGPQFKFRVGANEVIKGWDVGIQGMKVGGKRRLTVPPSMGYGKQGAPPTIPPNSTLVFDIELKSLK